MSSLQLHPLWVTPQKGITDKENVEKWKRNVEKVEQGKKQKMAN